MKTQLAASNTMRKTNISNHDDSASFGRAWSGYEAAELSDFDPMPSERTVGHHSAIRTNSGSPWLLFMLVRACITVRASSFGHASVRPQTCRRQVTPQQACLVGGGSGTNREKAREPQCPPSKQALGCTSRGRPQCPSTLGRGATCLLQPSRENEKLDGI